MVPNKASRGYKALFLHLTCGYVVMRQDRKYSFSKKKIVSESEYRDELRY